MTLSRGLTSESLILVEKMGMIQFGAVSRAELHRWNVELSYRVPGDVLHVTAENAITEGVFAFWSFGVDLDNNTWIEQNGIRLNSTQCPGVLRNNEFRKQLLFA